MINGVRSNITSPHLASQMFCKEILLMEEILHQLISIPLFTRFYTSQVVIAAFLNHQQSVQSKNKICLMKFTCFLSHDSGTTAKIPKKSHLFHRLHASICIPPLWIHLGFRLPTWMPLSNPSQERHCLDNYIIIIMIFMNMQTIEYTCVYLYI